MSSQGYVVARVGDALYAFPALQVQRVAMLERLTPVPQAPPFVDGVVYLQGQVVPVVNLRRRFGLERIPYDLHSRLIVTRSHERVVGFAVDTAREYVTLDDEAIFLPPEDLTTAGSAYLSGVALLGERLIFILDVARLLAAEELEPLPTGKEKE